MTLLHTLNTVAQAKAESTPCPERKQIKAAKAAPCATRRQLLWGAGLTALAVPALVAAPGPAAAEELSKVSIKVNNLTAFQKNDQRAAFQSQLEKELKKALTAADHPATLRLVLHDAATYDIETGTGGINGSIVTSEELGRPENRSLVGIVDRLRAVKETFDDLSAARGRQPVSWADLEVAAAKVAAEKAFSAAKLKRIGNAEDTATISSAFGASFPLQIGRIDSGTVDPAGRIPGPDAPVSEIVAFLKTLGTKAGSTGGFFGPKALFWEQPAFLLWTAAQEDPEAAEAAWVAADPQFKGIKEKYDRSKRTVTRTDYEVDFIDFFTSLAGKRCGARFDPVAYLTPLESSVPKLF